MGEQFQYQSKPTGPSPLPGGSHTVARAGGQGPAAVQRLPVTTTVQDVELFLSPFSGMGRMAHVQRQLATERGVRRVRIGGLVGERAYFVVTLDVGISLAVLVLANTTVVSASLSTIELSLRSNSTNGERSFGRRPVR